MLNSSCRACGKDGKRVVTLFRREVVSSWDLSVCCQAWIFGWAVL